METKIDPEHKQKIMEQYGRYMSIYRDFSDEMMKMGTKDCRDANKSTKTKHLYAKIREMEDELDLNNGKLPVKQILLEYLDVIAEQLHLIDNQKKRTRGKDKIMEDLRWKQVIIRNKLNKAQPTPEKIAEGTFWKVQI